MARLPQPGGDNGNWGDILNEYLSQTHDADGSLKEGSVTEIKLSDAVQAKLNAAATTPTWTSLPGKPAVVAAGTDQTVARSVIGAAGQDVTNTFTQAQKIAGDSDTYFTWRNGNGQDGSSRTPYMATSFVHADEIIGPGADLLNYSFNGVMAGDFAGKQTTNPGYAWGYNFFTTTGNGAVDGNGLTNFTGALIENSIRSGSGAHLGWVTGASAEAAFMGPTAGAHVDRMTSLQVLAPKYKDGATSDNRVAYDGSISGTITLSSLSLGFTIIDVGKKIVGTGIPLGTVIASYVSSTQVMLSQACTNGTSLRVVVGDSAVADATYGLWIEGVSDAQLSSTAAYSVWVDGGRSRFKGELEVQRTGTNDPFRILSNVGSVIARIDQAGVVYGLQIRTANDRIRLREDQGGGVIEFTPAVNAMYSADAGRWKMYFASGTTVGTVKMCVMGPSGTETTVMDNIPA